MIASSNFAAPSVIVCGASPTGLAVLRALGSKGVRTYVADWDSDRPAFYSRYRFGKRIVAGDAMSLAEELTAVAKREPEPPVVFPTSDSMVLALSENARLYQGRLRVHEAITSGLAARTVDKQSFDQLCKQAGVSTPQTAFPKTAEAVLDAGKQFQFPLLLKPILGHLWRDRLRGKKLLVAHSIHELERLVEVFQGECDGLMVQELIPGAESNIYVAAVYRGTEGSRNYCFVAEKTRQHPPGFGSASYATAKFCEEIAELSWKFVEGVDYRGVCGTEFKFDARDGRFKMIEVNPRPTLWFHLAHASGVNLIHGAYLDLIAQPVPAAVPQRDGTRWCFWEKDLLTWPHHLWSRDIAPLSLLSTFSPSNHGAVGTLKDPGPLLASPLYYLRRLIQRTLASRKTLSKV